MSEKKAKEYIINDIIRRFKDELKEQNYIATALAVREQTDTEIELEEIVNEYLNEYTEKTESVKDIIGTNDLFEKWEVWTRVKYEDKQEMLKKLKNIGINYFGREVHKFYERGMKKTKDNKTVRGFIKVRYKSETSKINEFMKKFTIKTEDKVLDRIKINEILYLYLDWGEGERIGPDVLNTRLQKYGYKTKRAYIKEKCEKLNGKTKIENKGTETHMCVMGVKWIPGAKEMIRS